MSQQLETAIQVARSLTTREKLELLQAISSDLQQVFAFTDASTAFWKPRSIEEIAASQTAPVVKTLADFVIDFWPEDEPVDDFIDYVHTQREADRSSPS